MIVTAKEIIITLIIVAIITTIIVTSIRSFMERRNKIIYRLIEYNTKYELKIQQYNTLVAEKNQIEKEIKDYNGIRLTLKLKSHTGFGELVFEYFERQRARKEERLNHVKSIMEMLENENILEINEAKNTNI